MKRIALWLSLLMLPLAAHAQTDTIQGACTQEGVTASLSGIPSTNRLDGIIPGCIVTVYLTGTTTKATIYADGSLTPLLNPFTADVAPASNFPGKWIFWAATGTGYDVVMSGGGGNPSCTTALLCYAHPRTLTDVKVGGGGGGGGVTQIVAGANIIIAPSNGLGTVTISSTGSGNLPAGTGLVGVAGGTGVLNSAANPAPTLNLSGAAPATNGGQISQSTSYYGCNGLGFSLGYGGTSAQGWTICKTHDDTFNISQPGIHQNHSVFMDQAANGDTDITAEYLTAFGGNTANSDEAVIGHLMHVYQRGFVSGLVTGGASTGSSMITAGTLACTGKCDESFSGGLFSPGGMLLDTHAAGITATIVGCATPISNIGCAASATGLNGMYYDISGATVTPSTAWGNIVPSSCTVRSASLYQVLQSMTCTITLGSGSGHFAATSAHIQLSGPFQEESIVTAVTPGSGTDSVTFTSRYAWDNSNGNTNGALVMQGGPGGQALILAGTQTSAPIAYQVVGATSSTRVYFSNCVEGQCNGIQSSNFITPENGTLFNSGTLTRTTHVVTLSVTGGGAQSIYLLPAGTSIVVSGAGDATFDGTFTVVSNTMDRFNPVITWAQTATDSTTTTFNATGVKPQITFYPMAFITGTNNGLVGVAQLGTNSVPFANGDSVVSAPTSQFQSKGFEVNSGQMTPNSPGYNSNQVQVFDAGPSPPFSQYYASNPRANAPGYVGQNMFYSNGAYANFFNFNFRPANNGALINVIGNDPVSGASNIPYYLFQDQLASAMGIIVSPASLTFGINGNLSVSGTCTGCSSVSGSDGELLWRSGAAATGITGSNTNGTDTITIPYFHVTGGDGLLVQSASSNWTNMIFNNTTAGGKNWQIGSGGSGGTPTTTGTFAIEDNTDGTLIQVWGSNYSIFNFPVTAPQISIIGNVTTSTPAQLSMTALSGHPPVPAAGSAVYGVDTSGNAEVSENGAAVSLLCTVANGRCPGSPSVGTAGQMQKVGATSGSFAASSCTDNGTNVTCTEPQVINAPGASQTVYTYNSTPIVPASGSAVVGADASGNYLSADNGAAAARVCNATNGQCTNVHTDYASIAGTLFATSTMLGPVFAEPVTATYKTIIVRMSGSITCATAPVVTMEDLGTSPSTAFGSVVGSVDSVTTGTSDGVYQHSASVNLTPGHYYGFAFSGGACATPPNFDITAQVQ
jgi:hypothetical protein